jgi:hypothetical protein
MKKVKGNNMKNTIAILGVAALLAGGVSQAHAGHGSISFGASFPLPLPLPLPIPVPVFHSTVVQAPAPVFVQSAPVVCPAPVAQAYVAAPSVIYAPQVVVAPPVVVARAPCYVAPGFGFGVRFGPYYHSHYYHH